VVRASRSRAGNCRSGCFTASTVTWSVENQRRRLNAFHGGSGAFDPGLPLNLTLLLPLIAQAKRLKFTMKFMMKIKTKRRHFPPLARSPRARYCVTWIMSLKRTHVTHVIHVSHVTYGVRPDSGA
jgi:hypothetical protein